MSNENFMEWLATIKLPDEFRRNGVLLSNGIRYSGLDTMSGLLDSLLSNNAGLQKRVDSLRFEKDSLTASLKKVFEEAQEQMEYHGLGETK